MFLSIRITTNPFVAAWGFKQSCPCCNTEWHTQQR